MKKCGYLFAAFFAVLALIACTNEVQTSVTEKASEGKAYVTIGSVSSARTGTIAPTVTVSDFTTFVLTGTYNEEESTLVEVETLDELTGKSLELDCGNWTFTLTAALGDEKFTSTVEQTISKTETNTLTFALEATSTTGAVDLTVSFTSTDVSKVLATLTPLKADTTTSDVTTESSTIELSYSVDEMTADETTEGLYSFDLSASDIAPGSYTLTLDFYSDDIDVPLNSPEYLVKILAGVTTSSTLSIIVNPTYTVSFVDSRDLATSTLKYFRKTGSIILPTYENSEVNGTFTGWSTDEEASTAEYAGGETFEVKKGDITLYAVWNVDGSGVVSIANDGIVSIAISDTDLYQNSIIAFSSTDADENPITDGITYDAKLLYKGTDINSYGTGDVNYYSVSGSTLSLNGTSLAIPKGIYQLYITATVTTDNGVSVVSSETFDVKVTDYVYYEIDDVSTLSDTLSNLSFNSYIKINQSTTDAYTDYFGTINTALEGTSYLVNLDLSGVTTTSETTNIEDSQFQNNTNLQSIIFPDDLTEFGSYAFASCTALESVTLGTGLTKIADGEAFGGCTALTTVNIPESSALKYIGTYAFNGCTALDAFTVPSEVIAIGCNAFYGCDSLDSITLASSEGTWYYTSSQEDWTALYGGGSVSSYTLTAVSEYSADSTTEENILALSKADGNYLYCAK